MQSKLIFAVLSGQRCFFKLRENIRILGQTCSSDSKAQGWECDDM